MLNIFYQRLNERKRIIWFSSHQWERAYIHLYEKVSSYNDLKRLTESNDVNTKIFTLSNIIPEITDLLTERQRRELEIIIEKEIDNKRMCEISYPCSEADEEDTETVSSAAKNALKILKENHRILESKLEI
jgi:hypothetical protein